MLQAGTVDSVTPPTELRAQLGRILWQTALVAILFLFVWYEHELLFLAFAGVLLAIALHTLAAWLTKRTPLAPKSSYIVVLLLLFALAAGIAIALAPRVIAETGQMAAVIPSSLHQMRHYLDERAWGRFLVKNVSRAMSGTDSKAMLTTFAKSLTSGAEGLVIILAVGFFAALSPVEYSAGLLRLLPERYRQQAGQVSSDVVYTLRWWLAGQLVPMVVLGVATMIGLWLLRVPLAFTLGLMTGALIFIPYIGALASEIPAVLVGLTQGPRTALYVLLLYLAVHVVEGYLLTPFVQKRAVRLPPLLTLLSQLLLWSMAGLAGVLVATPLAAVGLVLVKTLYLRERIHR